jgi:hypothetical protein
VQARSIQHDAALVSNTSQPWIAVSDRLQLQTWGVFCVVHEVGHLLLHPGSRDFYLRSPGWLGKTESQANVIALLALWPQRTPPYPRILKIEEDDGLVHLTVALAASSPSGLERAWTSRQLTLQRYK